MLRAPEWLRFDSAELMIAAVGLLKKRSAGPLLKVKKGLEHFRPAVTGQVSMSN